VNAYSGNITSTTTGRYPQLAHLNLAPDTPMVINCQWGAFDNEGKVLPRTRYDISIDKDAPRPGQQAFEKMVAGLYLGEIFRLIMVDLHDNRDDNTRIFAVPRRDAPVAALGGLLGSQPDRPVRRR